ncbi:MAG: membrane protein insertase YidC [Oscillospiraceae bacterium]|jgi:YidC/Oxa1 family membrane protein insertase|nr:membrane protein insertase YidC [Oscillospiraceae bacterium]
MLDFISIPFKYLLLALNSLTHNYGFAVILFSLVINAILTPFTAKSTKGQLRMQLLQPKVEELKKKHGANQQKLNVEMQALYKENGVSMTGGCLWSLIPLPILFALYRLIIQPFTKLWNVTEEQFLYLRDIVFPALKLGEPLAEGAKQGAMEQIQYAFTTSNNFTQIIDYLKTQSSELGKGLYEALSKFTAGDMNFSFLGLNLADIPQWQLWQNALTWAAVGLFLIPVLNAAVSVISMLVSNRISAKGGYQTEQQKQMNSNIMMLLMGPGISLWIGFTWPAIMPLYYLFYGLFSFLARTALTIHYQKVVAAEQRERDALRIERDREIEAKRAESDALKAEGLIKENPNVSKKKKELQEKQEREQKAREWEEAHGKRKSGEGSDEDSAAVGTRKFARGRAYSADRFKGNLERSDEDNNEAEGSEDEAV